MLRFDYTRFKQALKEAEARKYEELKKDLKQVMAFIEKAISCCLESTSHTARTKYLGIDI